MASGVRFGFSAACLQGLPFVCSHLTKPCVSSGPEWPELLGHLPPVP